jgi:hypothetical protein
MVQAGRALDVIEAAKDAGRQLVSKGMIAEETLKTVCRELMPMKTYFENANRGFQQTLDTREKK